MIRDEYLSKYLAQQRKNFEEPQSPAEFAQHAEIIAKTVRSRDYFSRDAKWLREAVGLAMYAEQSEASSIRLNRVDPPDGYVLADGHEYPIEHTFVFDQGYQPGQFYQPGSPLMHRECSAHRAADISDALRGAINKKIKKALKRSDYPHETILIVDLNMGSEGVDPFEIEEIMRAVLAIEHPPFSAVRCLWQDRLY